MYQAMSRGDRLERWAMVLERADCERIAPFRDVELVAPEDRPSLRTANSAIEIAYRDPILRREGLPSDRYGDGAEFFGLSRRQAHRVLCSCGYFGSVRGTDVAQRVRAIASRQRLREWLGDTVPAAARWVTGGLLPPRTA